MLFFVQYGLRRDSPSQRVSVALRQALHRSIGLDSCRDQGEAWGNEPLWAVQKPHKSRLEREQEAWRRAVRANRISSCTVRSLAVYLLCTTLDNSMWRCAAARVHNLRNRRNAHPSRAGGRTDLVCCHLTMS